MVIVLIKNVFGGWVCFALECKLKSLQKKTFKDKKQ